jgi:hypothetical protein
LSLAADDEPFAGRFHDIYSECAVPRPESPDGPQLRCGVRLDPTTPSVVVDVAPGGDDASLVSRLLHDQGYRAEPSLGVGWRRFAPPPGWPAAAYRDGCLVLRRDRPWQWLVGHLVVSRLLALQSDLLCFHAAAVAIGGRGVLLTGGRGSGKTSVSLTLAAHGHGFLSDEVGALRIATGQLVPVRRAALVRPGPGAAVLGGGVLSEVLAELAPDLGARLCVPVSRVFPQAAAHPADLRAVFHLRRFADASRLERLEVRPDRLDALTPMACSVHGADAGSRLIRFLKLLDGMDCYALDAASPASAAALIEQVMSG